MAADKGARGTDEPLGGKEDYMQYIQEKRIHTMFEEMVRHLLKQKPKNPRLALMKLMKRKLNLQEMQSTGLEESMKSSTVKSLQGSRTAPSPGSLCSSAHNLFPEKKKKVLFDSGDPDWKEITAVEERRNRGEFWYDGELEAANQQVEPTNECYFCCYEPNDCEWSRFSLYEEDNGDWHLVCWRDECLSRVKYWWRFAYTMGDTLNRCSIDTIALILSYLPRHTRGEFATISTDWRSAFWKEVSLTNVKSLKTLADVVSVEHFCQECTSFTLRSFPALGNCPDTFEYLVRQLEDCPFLMHMEITGCALSLKDYLSLASGVRTSIMNGTFRRFIMGPPAMGDAPLDLSPGGESAVVLKQLFEALSLPAEDESREFCRTVVRVEGVQEADKEAVRQLATPFLLVALEVD